MLVVIEVPDDMPPEAIKFELNLLAEDNARIVADDPDLDGGLALTTENCQLGVSRIVGFVGRPESTGYIIEPFES